MEYWVRHRRDKRFAAAAPSRSRRRLWLTLLTLVLLLGVRPAWGHSFPDHAEPRVGWTVDKPVKVTIWFDVPIEPVFSTIKVVNTSGQQVDKQDGRVDPADHTVLEVSLPPLPPGKYRVFWNVISIDTHRTEGDYPFTVGGKP
ncbi:MAG: copper resistance protein [Candidatus Methylomirabilota bacterium]|nr:MAG: copper resistance protein [candidate division NC10 bacterium]